MYRTFLSLMMLIVLITFSCTKNIDNAVSPMEPGATENRQDVTEQCRTTMRTIASQQVIFFATNGYFATTLEELGMAGLTCPGCGEEYILGDERTLYVACPMPQDPTHGYILDGVPSWHQEPSSYEAECQANMRTIASQEVIYFAVNDTYTDNLEDLGLEYMTCPECGAEYVLEINSAGDRFYLECGKPCEPNHGSIDNGVTSW